jgi:hypothetical protein
MKIGLYERKEWITTSVGQRMRRAISVLTDAMYYTSDLGCGVWDFAVSIGELRDAGLSDNDLRWLMRKGFVEQAIEITEAGDNVRSFRPASGCIFSDRTCFVRTESAQEFAFEDPAATLGPCNARNGHVASVNGHHDSIVSVPMAVHHVTNPTWDRDRQELRWGEYLVKQFKVPSPNQETILAAFEEERWPPRIDDPLPPQVDQDPKRRLHDTITTLNRNQKNPLIRFLGDGSGQGVRWEPVGRDSVRNGKLSRGAAVTNDLAAEPTDA